MSFQNPEGISLEKAKSEYIEILKQNGLALKTDAIPIAEAVGRTTSRPVYAQICSPHFNASVMYGIAVDANLTAGASETTPVILSSGQFIRVETGDPLPGGCDCIIMTEDIVEIGGGSIELRKPSAPWKNIRQVGEDICAGEMILQSYSLITPAALGAMIAGGISEVGVITRPVVGIIPIGDELVPPMSDPKDGDILEFNTAIYAWRGRNSFRIHNIYNFIYLFK